MLLACMAPQTLSKGRRGRSSRTVQSHPVPVLRSRRSSRARLRRSPVANDWLQAFLPPSCLIKEEMSSNHKLECCKSCKSSEKKLGGPRWSFCCWRQTREEIREEGRGAAASCGEPLLPERKGFCPFQENNNLFFLKLSKTLHSTLTLCMNNLCKEHWLRSDQHCLNTHNIENLARWTLQKVCEAFKSVRQTLVLIMTTKLASVWIWIVALFQCAKYNISWIQAETVYTTTYVRTNTHTQKNVNNILKTERHFSDDFWKKIWDPLKICFEAFGGGATPPDPLVFFTLVHLHHEAATIIYII